MAPDRNGPRPFTARSVIASTLLGAHPPRLPASALIRSGALFQIPEGTVRVALSRMVSAGELSSYEGRYALDGHLLARQGRQDQSRRGVAADAAWDGRWEIAMVDAGSRPASERAAQRDAMRSLRLAELREGVWMRPANLDPGGLEEARAAVSSPCRWFEAQPAGDAAELAARLWDLDGWAAAARELISALHQLESPLRRSEADVLPAAFTLNAGVLRHLQADPLLPPMLLRGAWPGRQLRADYERFDARFNQVWRIWMRSP